MSNTDWYAQLEATQPWKAFDSYFAAVKSTVAFATSEQVTTPKPAYAELDLAGVSAWANAMLDSLPPAERQPRKRRCAGLPRAYPKMWMARPHSNSLMFEFRTIQNMPNLRTWKE